MVHNHAAVACGMRLPMPGVNNRWYYRFRFPAALFSYDSAKMRLPLTRVLAWLQCKHA